MGDISIGDREVGSEPRPTAVPNTAPKQIQRLLIIEDDDGLRRTMTAALEGRARSVTACRTVAEALEVLSLSSSSSDDAALPPPDVIVLDVQLPDGDAFTILDRVAMLPMMPLIIAISGEASADQSFRLAQRGVRAFLPKPFNLAMLEQTVDSARAQGPDLIPHLRAAVGHAPVREVEDMVRQTMVTEALGRTRGSKNGAAKILRISRQLLQHMVRATAI